MATQLKGSFLDNLGKIYAIYTGGFVGFVILLGILEWAGLPNIWIGYLFMFLTIGVYALIGWLSRTAQVSEYYVAGRVVPAFYNGMATGSDWMSAASFISMAGGLYVAGYDGLAFVLGWTGGYVLVAILLAPYLRKFGQYTVPDFLGTRYGGNIPRFIGILVLLAASFTYVVAQVNGVGLIASRYLQLDFQVACFVGLLGILVCSMLGGMRAVTWTQVAQYIILIVAYLMPVVILSAQVTGVPIPELMYGQVLQKIQALEPTLGIVKSHVAPFVNAKGEYDSDGGPQLLRADLLPDDRHRVAAAYSHAVLHHAERQAGAPVGGLEPVLHLPAVLHGAVLCGIREAGSVPEHHRSERRHPAGLGAVLGRGRAGGRLRCGQCG